MAEFSFDEFVKDFPKEVAVVLKSEGYDTLQALLCAEKCDINELKLKKGHIGVVRSAVQVLQQKHETGPMFLETGQSSKRGADGGSESEVAKLCQLLGGLSSGCGDKSKNNDKGQCHHIVDFIPSSMFAEEEVLLGGSVTLKVNAKPKLDKVSPGMWIAANCKILKKLMKDDDKFVVSDYLLYTERIGELATRFTWSSVLLFDDEYRQRQAESKFAWGTDAPHLSTVMLHARQAPPPGKAGKQAGNGAARRPGVSGVTCRQFNTGSCSYGSSCKFEHACSICGGPHASKDHGAAGGQNSTPGGQTIKSPQ